MVESSVLTAVPYQSPEGASHPMMPVSEWVSRATPLLRPRAWHDCTARIYVHILGSEAVVARLTAK